MHPTDPLLLRQNLTPSSSLISHNTILPPTDAHLGWGCSTVLTSLLLFLLHILQTHLQILYHLHHARILHALPIPSTSGWCPGNLDLLKRWMGIWKNGYLGDITDRLVVQLGGVEMYTFKMC
jgi:hypothetical protein